MVTKTFLQRIKNLFSLGEVNPVQDEKLIFKILLACERASIIVVAVVSGVAVAAYGYLLASGYTEWEPIRWGMAILLFALATAITDVGVKYFIQKGAFDFFVFFKLAWWKDLSQNLFVRAMQFVAWVCMIALIAGMFLFDYYSVDSVRRPVANMVKKESKLNQDSISQLVEERENVRLGAVVGAITAIQVDINSTRRQIEVEKVRAANSNQKMKRLADSGNGWAKAQIKAAQAKATAPLQQRLIEQEGLKKELREQQARDLAYKSEVITKSDSTVFATNAAIESRNNDLVTGTSTMFIWLGFFAKCIAGLIRVMLVVLFLGNPVDANKDGKVDYRDVTSAAAGGFLAG
jgi:hypothetical protein